MNSAYYNRGTPINTISRAVATVGIHALREIATAIAVIEEFIKSGVEKDGICKTLTQSYLSACFAKLLCKEKNLPVAPEECFIGALLHNLGKMVLLIYQPEIYRRIEEKMAQGFSEEYCAKIVMNGLSCAQIGMEMAIFWNFPDKIVLAMDSDPPKPKNEFDTDGYLLNLAVFSNRLITTICQQSNFDLTDLILQYQKIFSLEKPEAISLVEKSIEASEEVSETIRYGLLKLKLRSKIIAQSQDFPANRSNCTSSRVS